MVSAHARGGRHLVRRVVVALMAATLVTGCSWTRGTAARTLPADRGADVLYVALGDSTVEGIGASRPELNYVSRLHALLRGIYPNARVVNLGMGGATSFEVLTQQLDRAIDLKPDLTTISVGPNDITEQMPIADYTRHMDKILGRLASETRAVVIVNLLPDLAITPRFRGHEAQAVVGRRSVEFNAVVDKLAKRHGAQVVDLYAPSRREVPARPELMARDGYHPSDLGYARWAELMWEAVRSRIRS
jgi:acyl-CoA thioesterase I